MIFAEQVKNPYLFRVDDIAVRVEYCGGKSLSDALAVSYTHLTLPTTPYV